MSYQNLKVVRVKNLKKSIEKIILNSFLWYFRSFLRIKIIWSLEKVPQGSEKNVNTRFQKGMDEKAAKSEETSGVKCVWVGCVVACLSHIPWHVIFVYSARQPGNITVTHTHAHTSPHLTPQNPLAHCPNPDPRGWAT